MTDGDVQENGGALSTSASLLARVQREEPDEAAWRRFTALYTPLVRCWCLKDGLKPAAVDDVSPRLAATTTPTQRYVGFGLIGGGGAALIVAGAFALINAGATSSAAESTPLSAEPYGGWARFQANENYGRALSAGEVCALAQQRSGADAAQVRDLCSSTSSTATIALVAAIAGGALVATGLVFAVTARSTPANTARWGATPWLARGVGGATLYATW